MVLKTIGRVALVLGGSLAPMMAQETSISPNAGSLGFRVHYTAGWRYPVIDSVVPGSIANRARVNVGDSLVGVNESSILVLHAGRMILHAIEQHPGFVPHMRLGNIGDAPATPQETFPLGFRVRYSAGAQHSVVDTVIAGSIAARSGVMKGDSVITFEGIDGADHLSGTFSQVPLKAGEKYKLVISRGGSWQILSVEIPYILTEWRLGRNDSISVPSTITGLAGEYTILRFGERSLGIGASYPVCSGDHSKNSPATAKQLILPPMDVAPAAIKGKGFPIGFHVLVDGKVDSVNVTSIRTSIQNSNLESVLMAKFKPYRWQPAIENGCMVASWAWIIVTFQ